MSAVFHWSMRDRARRAGGKPLGAIQKVTRTIMVDSFDARFDCRGVLRVIERHRGQRKALLSLPLVRGFYEG